MHSLCGETGALKRQGTPTNLCGLVEHICCIHYSPVYRSGTVVWLPILCIRKVNVAYSYLVIKCIHC